MAELEKMARPHPYGTVYERIGAKRIVVAVVSLRYDVVGHIRHVFCVYSVQCALGTKVNEIWNRRKIEIVRLLLVEYIKRDF